MIKVEIKKSGIVTNAAQFETQEQANAWVAQESANGSFGRNERWVILNSDGTIYGENINESTESRVVVDVEAKEAVLDEDGNEISPAIEQKSHTEHRFAADYVIECVDLTNQLLEQSRDAKLEEFRQARDAKLKRMDNLVNIAFLNSWTSIEKTELRNYRQALLDITESYKADRSLLDSLDIAAVEWPVEPAET